MDAVETGSRAAELIMVAERDERIRETIARALEDHGYLAVPVPTAAAALAAALGQRMDAVVLDTGLLIHSPSVFLHELRATSPSMRFVIHGRDPIDVAEVLRTLAGGR